MDMKNIQRTSKVLLKSEIVYKKTRMCLGTCLFSPLVKQNLGTDLACPTDTIISE